MVISKVKWDFCYSVFALNDNCVQSTIRQLLVSVGCSVQLIRVLF